MVMYNSKHMQYNAKMSSSGYCLAAMKYALSPLLSAVILRLSWISASNIQSGAAFTAPLP